MGAFTTAEDVHNALRLHPNFKFPRTPLAPKHFDEVVDYVLEAVARYVSPPKRDGEDDELECINVATAIREHLAPEIRQRLGLNESSSRSASASVNCPRCGHRFSRRLGMP